MSVNEMSFSPVRMRGSSEESAIAQALMIVGATRDQVQVEIVEQNEKGVTVRVSPRQDTPDNSEDNAEKVEAISEAAGDDGNDAITGAMQDDANDADDAAESETPIPQNNSSDYASSQAGDVDAEINPETIADIATETSDESDASESDASDDETTETESAADESVNEIAREPVSEEARERAGAMAREMLERMGLEANVELADGPFSSLEAGDEDASSRVYLQIEGEDVGILIGKHGATLQSFQYLLNLSLNNDAHNARDNTNGESENQAPSAMLRVVVDAGGYRAKRADMLEKSAQDGAESARRDRRSVRLEPMPAHERRLIHMALRDENGITTSSEGREPLRHVVISPEGMRPASNERAGGQNQRGGYRGGGFRGGRDRR